MAENILTKGEGLPGWGKTIIFVGAGIVIVIVGYKIYRTIKKGVDDVKEGRAADFFTLRVFTEKTPLAELAVKSGFKSWNTLPKSQALSIANEIYQSQGVFNDDETKFYGALKKIQYKSDLYYINLGYWAATGKNIIDAIGSFTNDEEREKAYKILKAIPDFRNPVKI